MEEPMRDCSDGPVNLAWFDDQLILLDVRKNKYATLSPEQSSGLVGSAHHADSLEHAATHTWGERGAVMAKRSITLISGAECGRPRKMYIGVSSNCWKLKSGDVSFARWSIVTRALRVLHSVHRCSRAEQLAGLERLILQRRSRRGEEKRCDIDQLVRSMNGACMLYWKRTKCLEWGVALVLLGFEYGFDLRLFIGVQNRPFYAHAWVQLNDQVIGDDQCLPEQLAVIRKIN